MRITAKKFFYDCKKATYREQKKIIKENIINYIPIIQNEAI